MPQVVPSSASRALSVPFALLAIAAVAFAFLAVWTQPPQADDWDLAWEVARAGSIPAYVAELYMNWGGRVLPFTLGGVVVSSAVATGLFKCLIIPCFLLFAACVHDLGTGAFPSGKTLGNWLLTTAILWLGLPVPSDTVIQTSGSAGYLWMATLGLAFLCICRRLRDAALPDTRRTTTALPGAGLFALGTLVGLSNEQFIVGVSSVLAGWGWMLWRSGRLRFLPGGAYWALAGLVLGGAVLVAAPGNYVRFASSPDAPGDAVGALARYVLYLGGAYFGLGTGDAGRTLWLGIGVIALRGMLDLRGERGREAAVWLLASVATLVPMLPLVSFASPRTTFLAAIFLVVAALNAFPRANQSATPSPVSWLLAYALASLVVIDCLAGWAANRTFAKEMSDRLAIIERAASRGEKEVVVPFIATIPSRLTFMLNPQHDAVFLNKLAAHHGFDKVRHDASGQGPLPHTLHPLKALRNTF